MTHLLTILFLLLACVAQGAGLGPYNPAQHSVNGFMPTQLGAKLWLAANHLRLTNGQGVATWKDFSGFGNDLSQSTGSIQPAFSPSKQNGQPVVQFDGVDDWIGVSSLNSSITNPLSVYAVIFESGEYGYICDSYSSANRVVITHGGDGLSYSNKLSIYAGGAANLQTTSKNNGQVVVVSCVFNTTSSKIFVSGIEASYTNSSASIGNVSMSSLKIGSRFNSQYFLNGFVSEFIAFPKVLSTTQRLQVERYLGTKYGIVVK